MTGSAGNFRAHEHGATASSRVWRDAVAVFLIAFGAALVGVALASAGSVKALVDAPLEIWFALCGAPRTNSLVLPGLFVGGGLMALFGAGMFVLPRVRPAVRFAFVAATAAVLGSIAGGIIRTPISSHGEVEFNLPPNAIYTANPPRDVGNFILRTDDDRLAFFSDLRGKPMFLFFGYTHCPDVCPLTMSEFMQVKRALGDTANDINFVMVSVDGERDTPDVMHRYVKAFDPAFIGLTGPAMVVSYIAGKFGARFEKQTPQGTAASYLVAHTTFSYLLDAQGRLLTAYPLGTPPERMAGDAEKLLSTTR